MFQARTMVTQAKAAEESFKLLVRTVANKLNAAQGDILWASVKEVGAILCKADRKYNGDIGQVKDMLRATVTVHRFEQVEKARRILDLMKEGKLSCISQAHPYRIKDSFADAALIDEREGYCALSVNFNVQGFCATEIQLRLPADQKMLSRSHKAYEAERACEHALAALQEHPEGRIGALRSDDSNALMLFIGKKMRSAAMERSRCNERAFQPA